MKKNILFRILMVILILISFLFINMPKNYAGSISEAIQGADDFIQAGINDTHPTIDNDDLETLSDMLYNAVLVVAIIIAVIFGLVIGIKFMTGSVEQKAEVKKTLIPYIAGCVVIFGAFTIWKLVVNLLSQV